HHVAWLYALSKGIAVLVHVPFPSVLIEMVLPPEAVRRTDVALREFIVPDRNKITQRPPSTLNDCRGNQEVAPAELGDVVDAHGDGSVNVHKVIPKCPLPRSWSNCGAACAIVADHASEEAAHTLELHGKDLADLAQAAADLHFLKVLRLI